MGGCEHVCTDILRTTSRPVHKGWLCDAAVEAEEGGYLASVRACTRSCIERRFGHVNPVKRR